MAGGFCTGESHWYYFSAVMGLGMGLRMGLNLYVDEGPLDEDMGGFFFMHLIIFNDDEAGVGTCFW